jgi:hypothetical protein
VRQELGAIGRHVHVRGAFGLAGFAGKTEIERFFNVFVLPAILNDLALQLLRA